MRLKKRTGIGARLIIGFTLLVLLLAALALYSVRVSQEFLQESVGQGSIFLADEMLKRIDHNIYLRLEELQRYAKDATVQETIGESNQKFEKLNNVQAYITEKDQEWTSTPAETITPLMQELIDNQLSEELSATFIEIYEKKYGYKVYGEIFVTNKYGANVAQTGKTSDYRQDDEEWWQVARERGWYVGDIEYDESVGTYGISMAVRIDDDEGNWLGVIKAVVPVGGIAREAEIATKKYETTEIELITQEGQRIYATKPFRFLEDISQKEFFKKIERESDFFVAEEAGRERLFAYASSKGYRDFIGLPWVLVVNYDVEEILEPIFVLRNSIVVASAILIIVSVAIAFYFSRSISKPVTKLKQAAEDISKGKLGIQIDSQVLSSNDEIGDLAQTFDYMAKSLEQREREVVKRTRELETSEKALRESEEKYRSVIENANVGIVVIQDGQQVFYNSKMCEMLGYTEEEYGKINFISTIHPEDRSYAVDRIRQRLMGVAMAPDVAEMRVLTKSGDIKWVEGNSAVVQWKGRPANQAFVIDITERKQAEEALRESEERFRSLSASAPVGIFLTDREGLCIYTNARLQNIAGLTFEESLGYGWNRAIHPDDREAMLEEASKKASEGREFSREFRILTPQGELHWVHGRATVIFSEEGEQIGRVGTIEDITERKQAEESLRESEERYRSLFEGAKDHIFVIDQDFRYVIVNPSALKAGGFTLADIAGKGPHELFPEDADFYISQYRRAFETGEPVWFERELRLPDGLHWFSVTLSPIKNAQGHVIALTGISRDTTERRQLEEQFRQSQKMEAIGKLAGGMAHDFNNLLTVITGYSELLLHRYLDSHDPRHREIEQIHKAGERAASLTHQLLAFSRQQVIQPAVLDLNAVIADMNEMLRRLISEDIDLITNLDSALGRVKADLGQMEQIIMNLAVNAHDAMPQGGQLTIETANVDLDEDEAGRYVGLEPGSYIMLKVSDTGVGMDTEIRSHIFEPFFTTKQQNKGTGLGLATVYGIVQQNDGHISVSSEPGRGTTFQIYLPRIEQAAALTSRGQAPSEFQRGTETILLVEDEDMVRDLARYTLLQDGYTVLEARDGQEALEVYERHQEPIHLLLTDVIMPGGLRGYELAKRLTSLRPEIKVLYMSGYTDDAIPQHELLDPDMAFLQKPFSPTTLARKVREVLDAS